MNLGGCAISWSDVFDTDRSHTTGLISIELEMARHICHGCDQLEVTRHNLVFHRNEVLIPRETIWNTHFDFNWPHDRDTSTRTPTTSYSSDPWSFGMSYLGVTGYPIPTSSYHVITATAESRVPPSPPGVMTWQMPCESWSCVHEVRRRDTCEGMDLGYKFVASSGTPFHILPLIKIIGWREDYGHWSITWNRTPFANAR